MEYLLAVQEVLLAIWGDVVVKFIVCHILLNVVLALAAAIATSNFRLYRLWVFLYRKIIPMVVVYSVARLIARGAGVPWLATAVLVVLETRLFADLLENLKKLGVPVPDRVMGWLAKTEA